MGILKAFFNPKTQNQAGYLRLGKGLGFEGFSILLGKSPTYAAPTPWLRLRLRYGYGLGASYGVTLRYGVL